ncbi:MAG: hypothetical protein Q7U73_14985 [Rubrivivax sp.]|nr:hypothetical protein [Rubrivivax sp.]
MMVSKLTSVLGTLLVAGSTTLAVAAEGDGAAAERPLSRAEVLADLQIWRESGLEALQEGEESAVYTPRHDAALARYAALRASPAFGALVQRIAQQRGERVLMSAAK